jgi:hypothetical protein
MSQFRLLRSGQLFQPGCELPCGRVKRRQQGDWAVQVYEKGWQTLLVAPDFPQAKKLLWNARYSASLTAEESLPK